MDDAVGSSHPLHVTGADQAASAGGVAVLQFALVNDGHGLEASVRVLANAAPCTGRGEVMRASIVQQQERADLAGQVVVGEQAAHRKTITYPVSVGAAVNTQNRFHEKAPLLVEITLPVIPIKQ